MKNNYRKTLINELYKSGFGLDYCKSLANEMLQIGGEGNECMEWKQDILEGRLKMIKKAIQSTLIEEGIKKVKLS